MKTQLAQNVLAIISDDITKMDGFFKSPDDITKIVGQSCVPCKPLCCPPTLLTLPLKIRVPPANATHLYIITQHIDYFIWQVPNTLPNPHNTAQFNHACPATVQFNYACPAAAQYNYACPAAALQLCMPCYSTVQLRMPCYTTVQLCMPCYSTVQLCMPCCSTTTMYALLQHSSTTHALLHHSSTMHALLQHSSTMHALLQHSSTMHALLQHSSTMHALLQHSSTNVHYFLLHVSHSDLISKEFINGVTVFNFLISPLKLQL